MYDKKIAYLHYIKKGALMGNAGHAKITFRGNGMTMEIFVRDMHLLPSGYYWLKGLGESALEDKVHIEKGQAVYKKRLEADKNGKEKFPYGIRIEIGNEEYIEAVWSAGKHNMDTQAAEETVCAGERDNNENVSYVGINTEEVQGSRINTQQIAESDKQVQNDRTNLQSRETGVPEKLTFSVPLEVYEDKWKELCKKYEVVHPFGNREEYLSIAPKDFIIFPEKYQNLVNNSFLLHGYYNYQHIILGKKEEGGKSVYYLGVPGVYYEREKMVAIMFGFEGFECGDKKADNGGFGYYMRRVEL